MLLILLCSAGSLHVQPAGWLHKYVDALHDFDITIPFCFVQVTCWVSSVH